MPKLHYEERQLLNKQCRRVYSVGKAWRETQIWARYIIYFYYLFIYLTIFHSFVKIYWTTVSSSFILQVKSRQLKRQCERYNFQSFNLVNNWVPWFHNQRKQQLLCTIEQAILAKCNIGESLSWPVHMHRFLLRNTISSQQTE